MNIERDNLGVARVLAVRRHGSGHSRDRFCGQAGKWMSDGEGNCAIEQGSRLCCKNPVDVGESAEDFQRDY